MTVRTWTGAGTTSSPKSGKWSTKNAWSPTGVPVAGDDVILAGSGAYTVTLDVNTASLNSLTIANSGATLAIGTFTLAVAGTGASAINLQAGQIAIAGGAVSDAGGMALAAGTSLSGTGTLNVSGHYTGSGLLQANGGTLDVFGTIDSGVALQIASATGSNLTIEGTATAAAAILINSANQTLTIGANGNLAINAAENITNGTILLAGGSLSDSSGIVIGGGASLTGKGTVAGPLSGTGLIKANGGILDLTGTVASGLALAIGNAAGSDLKIDGTASAAGAISIGNSHQTLEIGASGSLTIAAAESITNGNIQLDGGTLTDAAGITIGSAALLIGNGTVNGPLSGPGTIEASGGTLDLKGTISSGPAFLINTTAGSELKIDGTATAASAVAISNANQTLEIGPTGNLTIGAAESITNGTLRIDGGSLTDVSGISLGSGAHLTGSGTVTAGATATTDVDGAGSVTASGGTLEFKTAIDRTTASVFDIANVAGSVLKFDATVGTTTVNPIITFDGTDGGVGVLDLTSTTLANFHGVVANFADFEGIKVANATSASLDSTGKILTVFNGSTSLGTITFSTSHLGDAFVVQGGTISLNDLVATLTSTTATEGTSIGVTVTDDGLPVTASSYQWQVSHNGGPWSNATGLGATSAIYTPSEGDEGGALRVLVVYAEAAGAESATSTSTNPVLDAAPTITTPTISGTAQEGQTLTASASSGQADNPVTYQWQANGADISGATGATYIVQEGDEGQIITVKATATNDNGVKTSATSAATAAVLDAAPTITTPTISGTAQEGETLTASASSGQADNPVTYQWQANGTDISGATGATYVVQEGDEGKTITVTATATNDNGVTISATSAATAAVLDAAPTITTPTISGTAQEGETLTASASSGQSDNPVSYQWQANGTDISGATGATYVVQEGDEGKTITVTATATNDNGVTISATSAATAAVLDAAPTVTTPTISGTAQEGQTLSASATAGQADNQVTYAWYSSVDNFTNPIGTGATYLVQEGDENFTIEARATATNDNGATATQTSAPTAKVVDNSSISVTVSIVGGSAVQEGVELGASATIGSDTDDVNATIAYQWQSSSDGGTNWTNIPATTSGMLSGVLSSIYQVTEADEGKVFRAIASFTDDTGQVVTATSAPTAAAKDVPPVITVPFSFAADEFIVSKPTATFDDKFTQGPPPVGGFFGTQLDAFSTNGGTFTEVNGKAILSSAGVTGGLFQPIISAVYLTNTQHEGTGPGQSEFGLKEDQTFTVSGTYDLAIPPGGASYGIQLNNSTPTQQDTEQVTLEVQAAGNGGIFVNLFQQNPTGSTSQLVAGQFLSAAALAGYTQIELDLNHPTVNVSTITGSFELLGNGMPTASFTLNPVNPAAPAHVFDHQTYTRAYLTAFGATPTISGLAQEGQTLSVSAATNDTDATLHYQWQSSPSTGPQSFTAIAGASDSPNYVVQEGDENRIIRVVVSTTDPDSTATASATSSATVPVLDAPPSVTTPIISGTPQEGQTLIAFATAGQADNAVTYAWYSSADNFTNPIGTGATYQIKEGDEGFTIEAKATATNDNGVTATAASQPTAAVLGIAEAPFLTVPASTFSFASPVSYAAGPVPEDLAVGTINGEPAIVVSNFPGNHTISVLQGDGAGHFGAPASYSSGGTSPNALVLGDFNNDGIQDVAVVNQDFGGASVLLGNPNGTFGPATQLTGSSPNPNSLATGDFNHDGNLDLVLGQSVGFNLLFYRGNGNGTFQSPTTLLNGYQVAGTAVGDVNHDGNADILASVEQGTTGHAQIVEFLGNGNGTFGGPSFISSLPGTEASLALADLQGNGVLDLIAANTGTPGIQVLMGDGHGGFGAPTAYGTVNPQNDRGAMAVADFTGDGKLDVAVINGGNSVALFVGNGDGTFQPEIDISIPGATALAAGDVNHDGHPDLVVSDTAGNVVDVLLAQPATTGTTTEGTPVTINGITLAAVDGDDALSMNLSAAHGTLALGSTAGLTITSDGNNGTLAFSGSQASIAAALASGVIYTPTGEYTGTDTLTVVGTASESTSSASTTQTIALTITPAAEPPSLAGTATSVMAAEGATVALPITVTPRDGDDTIMITIGGVPSDATLSAGINNHNGTWTLTPDQLPGLMLTAGETASTTATSYSFSTLDSPFDSNTQPAGINNSGEVIATGNSGTFTAEGALFNGVSWSTVKDPAPGTVTVAAGVNDAGDVVGLYTNNTNPGTHGFLFSGGGYTTIDYPQAANGTEALGISDAGEIVGNYVDGGGVSHGFTDIGNIFATLDDPAGSQGTRLNGISHDGSKIVGTFVDAGGTHGFLYNGGNWTTLNDPLGVEGTFAQGVNNAGEVVGFYLDSHGLDHGFVYQGGTFTTVDDALATNGGRAFGINDAGQIVGIYNTNVQHGYVANPVPTSTGTLIVTATNSEGPGASTTQTIALTVNPAAEPPSVSAPASITVTEDQTIALPISVTAQDADDVISVTITGVPVDAMLSAGTNNGNGSWTLTPNELSGLTLTAGDEAAVNLTVTATNSEGISASATTSIALNVLDVARTVTATITGTAQEGQTLTAHASDNDPDATFAYQWRTSADGTNWSAISGATGATYVVQEGDENQLIDVVITSLDAGGNSVSTTSAATTKVVDNSSISLTVTVANNAGVQEGQQLVASATITGDADDANATVAYQWQSSLDGSTWTNVGGATTGTANGVTSSFYQLTEADEGKQFRVQASFTDDTGQLVSATSAPSVATGDATPVITIPFSYAVDELSIVKGGTLIYDDTFSQAPPNSPTILGPNNVPTAINYVTLGSTWTEVNGKAVMSSAGVAPSSIPGVDQVIARLNTNTNPSSTAGLKLGSNFTVSAKFDLTAAPPGATSAYGLSLNDSTPTHAGDQVIHFIVQGFSNGVTQVELQQINVNGSQTTVNNIATQTLTAAQLAGNDQIEFDLDHVANTTAITGTFKLINQGSVTSSTTFSGAGQQGTIFVNNVNWTRAEVGAFTGPGVTISGTAQEGQTLTANAATNDVDATLHYQWQSSADGSTWTNIAGALDQSTYVVQESDENSQIRVVASTTDQDNNLTASATSGATAKVIDNSSLTVTVATAGNTAMQEGQLLVATGTITGDADDTSATIAYQWQSSSDGGATWTSLSATTSGQFNGAASSFYQLAEGDEGKIFRAQASFTNDTGQVVSATSAATTPTIDVTPAISGPFSYAVDEFKVTKSSLVLDDTFTQGPPPVGGVFGNNTLAFSTSGSTWTEVNGKAIAAASGAVPNAANTANILSATLLTNTQPAGTGAGQSESGLKQDQTFTVSGTYDLTQPAPGGGGYGIQLTNALPGVNATEQLQLQVQRNGTGANVVLTQQNVQTGTSTPIASIGVTAAQIASNTQIELDLAHTDTSANITGSFELIENGIVGPTVTVGTGHVFSNQTWTRAQLFDVAPKPTITGGALEGQTLTANAVSNDADATLHYQWQSSNPDGSFSNIAGSADSANYVVQESDENRTIRVVVSTTDPDNNQTASVASNPTQTVRDIPPTLTPPFSFAADQLSILKNGTLIYDNTFAQAPPFSPAVVEQGTSTPVSFQTTGVFADSGGKAVMAPSGGAFFNAQLLTNSDPSSSLGLKQGSDFTVSSTFDLTLPPPSSQFGPGFSHYGISLTDLTPTHAADQVVNFWVQGFGGSTPVITLQQANQSAGTFQDLGDIALTPDQLAGNDQIAFHLSHVAGSTAITGSFDLIDNGVVTSTTTFSDQGTIFTNGVDWTQASLNAFVAANVLVSGTAQERSTLTASVATNDADATIHYAWQSSSDGTTWNAIAGAADSATYVVQESDENQSIRVVATTTDPDNALTATATSSATLPVLDAPPSVTTPVISGVAQEGQTLTVSASAGQPDNPVTYAWYSSADAYTDPIGFGASYQVQEGDEGFTIEATATATNDNGATATASSAPTSPVIDAAIIISGLPPSITLSEGGTTSLNFTASGDSDDAAIIVSGLPADATLNPVPGYPAPINNGNGTRTITGLGTVTLSLTVGEDTNTTIVLSNAEDGSVIGTIPLTVTGVPETPSLTLPAGPIALAAPVAIPAGSTTGGLAVDEINGRPDIVVSNFPSPSSISVLAGDGAGNFSPPTTYPSGGSAPNALILGDFNNDGIQDVAVVNQDGGGASVLLGNPDGSFGPAMPLSNSGFNPNALATGDFNHDGNLDLVLGESTGEQLFYYQGNGNGTFQDPVTLASGYQIAGIALGDLTGDGNPDIFAAASLGNNVSQTDIIEVVSNGNGTFGAAQVIATLPGSMGSLALADLDGDGVLDLIAADVNSPGIIVMKGDGHGGFGAPTTYGTVNPQNNVDAMVVGDFNQDGKLDVAVVNASLGIAIFQGNGDGTFAPEMDISIPGSESIAAGDINGDGRTDLVVSNNAGNVIDVLTSLPSTATIQATEGGSVALPISVTPQDGDDQVTVTISGLPGGTTLSAGIKNNNGSWTLTPAQLPGLQITNAEETGVPTWSYSTFQFGPTNSQPRAINNVGQIVGTSGSSSASYLYNVATGASTLIVDPNATGATQAYGLNDNGQVVGYYVAGGTNHAFLYSGGSNYTDIIVPGSSGSNGNGINDAGEIVGSFVDATGTHGFLDNGGTFQTLNDPMADSGGTIAYDINTAGQVVGTYHNAQGTHGFLYANGTYITLDDPFAIGQSPGGQGTYATGISNDGEITGYYWDNVGAHGFVYDIATQSYTTLDAPGVHYSGFNGTVASGINDAGQVTGEFDNGTGSVIGFLASLQVAPTTLTVAATNTEGGGASTSATINLVVTPAAEGPSLKGTASQLTAPAGAIIAFPISLTTHDSDDPVTITVSGVPSDAALSAGTNNHNGTWTLTRAQLSNLTITVGSTPATLKVTAVTTEGISWTASQQVNLTLGQTTPTLWGTSTYPTQPITGVHLYGPNVAFNGGLGADFVLSPVTTSSYSVGGPDQVTYNVVLRDAFMLPYASGIQTVGSTTITNFPVPNGGVFAPLSTTQADVIAFYVQQDSSGAASIGRTVVTEGAGGFNTPVTVGTPTTIEPGLTGSVEHINTSFTTNGGTGPTANFLATYGLAWQQFDSASQTFAVNFQVFNPDGSLASPVEQPINLSNIATDTAAPAWFFRNAGGAAAYGLASAQHDATTGRDSIHVQGYNIDGSLNTNLNFTIAPSLSAGATNQITQEPLSPTHTGSSLALQFAPNAAANTGFSVVWNETVHDQSSTYDQVEFAIVKNGQATSRSLFPILNGNVQNVRVQTFNYLGANYEVLAYGDSAGTHLVEFDINGKVLATAFDSSTTTFNQLESYGDGRVGLIYDNQLDASGTTQYTEHVYDLRTSGIPATGFAGISNQGTLHEFAGTQYNDTINSVAGQSNTYYFVGSATGTTPSDTFTGNGGWNVAVMPDAITNYTFTQGQNGSFTLTNTGDPLHAGSLTLTNVQEVAFAPTIDPGGNTGSLTATGNALVVVGPLPNGGEPITISDGTILGLATPDSGTVTFAGPSGTLMLFDPSSFTGTIAGWAPGETIDLVDTQVKSAAINGSTLTVTQTNNQVLSYQLSGQFAGEAVAIDSDGNGGSDLSLVSVGGLWGSFTFPGEPTIGTHIYGPSSFGRPGGANTIAITYGVTPAPFNPNGPDTITENFLPVDPFMLPGSGGSQPLQTFDIEQFPFRSAAVYANTSASATKAIALYETQDQNGNPSIYRDVITGGLDSDGPFVVGAPTQIESGINGTLYNLVGNIRTPSPNFFLSSYTVTWDAFNAQTETYNVSFQLFSASDNTLSGSVPILSQSNIGSITDAPAWQFRGGGGGYIDAIATHGAGNQDFLQFQGYSETDGSPDNQNFQILPDLTAFASGATNHIKQQLAPGSTRPLQQIQFTQFGQGNTTNRYAIGWNETVVDSAGTHDQVEFVVYDPTTNAVVSRSTYQFAGNDVQNVQVATFGNGGQTVAALIYGETGSTHLVEFDQNGNQLAAVTDNTPASAGPLEIFGDGRLGLTFNETVDAAGTSQTVTHVYDLRTSGVSINLANAQIGTNQYVAGTEFSDTFVGAKNVNNTYYYVGRDTASGPTPTDSFTGGTGGWNVAIMPDDASNYSISTVNGTTALTNIGDPAHAGTLNLTNVQEILFEPSQDPGGNPGALEATGKGMLLLGPLPNGGESITIDDGAVLELATPDAGSVLFAGSAGTLQLDPSATFTGSISGFAGLDGLDLRELVYGANTTVGYAANANGTGGTLTVNDGTHIANIAIVGSYTAANFATVTDGQGGTLVQHH